MKNKLAVAVAVLMVCVGILVTGGADAAPNKCHPKNGCPTTTTTTTTTTPDDPGGTVTNVVVVDPKAHGALMLQGRGNIARSATSEVVLYWEEYSSPSRIVAHITNLATGVTNLIDLPSTTGSWTNPSLVLTASNDLWVLAGDAPIRVRQYHLTATTATLVTSRTFGNSDSRNGGIIQLASGALVAVWHQQGETTSQGHGIAYRTTNGVWQEQFQSWASTRASKDAVAQHPVDGSVWLFNDADAFGRIGAMHLTETSTGLRMDWNNHSYIGVASYGDYGPDPENPDLVAVADPSGGTIVLAYQSAHRQRYTATLVGSWPVIARLQANGTLSFTHLPVWVERVSRIALSLRNGEVWLAHRIVNTASLTATEVQLRVLHTGTWGPAISLGSVIGSPIGTTTGGSFAVNTSDQKLHVIRVR